VTGNGLFPSLKCELIVYGIDVKGFKVPDAVFENTSEKTLDPKLIGNELDRVAKKLWSVKATRQ
jgi:hypothetical protein